MTGEKVLLIEDTEDTRILTQMALVDAGFEVTEAADGSQGLRELFSSPPDVVLLDIMMPGMDGFTVCQRIRDVSDVPVIMLTALGEESEKIRAFEAGADDYIVKGTGTAELMARIKAALRRAQMPPAQANNEVFNDGVVEVDYKRQSVAVRGQKVELTPTEYGLLTTLIRSEGGPVTSRDLLNTVWGSDYDPELVKWHVARLRQKIEKDPSSPDIVVTRRGYGYAYKSLDE